MKPEAPTSPPVRLYFPLALVALLLLAAAPTLPAAATAAPALSAQPSGSLRNALVNRLQFEELGLQLLGVVSFAGESTCFVKHPGSSQPMTYHVGQVIGGYAITRIERASVSFERHGAEFVLETVEPEAEASTAEAPAAEVAASTAEIVEAVEAVVEAEATGDARPALPKEIVTLEPIEKKSPLLKLKSRTSAYKTARLTEAAPAKASASRPGTRVASSETRVASSSRNTFIAPMRGQMTSRYGYRRHTMGGGTKFHAGIDIAAGHGSQVVAAAAGSVTHVGYSSMLGRYVRIQHANGYETTYAHLYRAQVREGQKVSQGQGIALEGNTGNSTGPHLHFVISRNGKTLDPLLFVKIPR